MLIRETVTLCHSSSLNEQQHVTAQLEGPICLCCAINMLCYGSFGTLVLFITNLLTNIKHFSMTIDTLFKRGHVIYKKKRKKREIRITNYCKDYNQLLLAGK